MTDPTAPVTETVVDAVAFRRLLGEFIGRTRYGHERIVVSWNGRESSALIGPRDLERLRALDNNHSPKEDEANVSTTG